MAQNAEHLEFGDDDAVTRQLGNNNNGSNGLGDMDVSGDDLGPHPNELLNPLKMASATSVANPATLNVIVPSQLSGAT